MKLKILVLAISLLAMAQLFAAIAKPSKQTPQVTVTAAVTPNNLYAHQFSTFALHACDDVEKNLPAIERVADVVAERNLAGGLIGFPWNGQSLQQELSGRSGGMMKLGFGSVGQTRLPEQDKNNVAIIGWERTPGAAELGRLNKLHEAGTYIIGFGPRDLPELQECAAVCDAFFDTGLGADDRVVTLPNGIKAGRGNVLVNMLNGWALTGEIVAALTRRGKMPLMWQSFMVPEGRAWADKYSGKGPWHDDYQIAPIEQGQLSRAFLAEIRANIHRFEDTQTVVITRAVQFITGEMKAGRKTIVATQGHAPWTYVGKSEDAAWAILSDVEAGAPKQIENHRKNTPDGALVLRLGYSGLNVEEAALFAEKKQRVLLISTPSPRPEFQIPSDLPLVIDMGWAYGDAAVAITNYPIEILPPSGIMQDVAYESINVEVLARLQG